MKNILTLLLAILVTSTCTFATIHTISVANFSFSPASVPTVALGDTVKWIWVNGNHTTSTSIPAGATTWNSRITNNSTSFIYVPTVAGTYNYECTPHAPSMAGSFTVTSGGTTGGGTTGSTTYTITVANISFTPASIPAVHIGDTVKWVWINGSHTTTSLSVPSGAASWNSPINSSTTTFSYVPSVAGTYSYECSPHSPSMAGSFIVVANTGGTGPLPPGIVRSIKVEDDEFKPSNLSVSVGDTIRWYWHKGNHTTTSTTIPSGASSWSSPINSSSTEYRYVVRYPGTYNYICQVHGTMMSGKFTATSTTTGILTTPGSEILSFYPNPAIDAIHLDLSDFSGGVQITILDAMGRFVTKQDATGGSNAYIPIKNLPNGQYILQAKGENLNFTSRFAVAH